MAGGQSKQREIAEKLLERIKAGEFAGSDGERPKLPTEAQLQAEYSVSRNTIRDALAWLADRGWLESQRGKGTFVVYVPETFHVTLSAREDSGGGEGEAWFNDAAVEGRTGTAEEIEVGVRKATGEIARHLRIPEDDQVVFRQQKMHIDRWPWLRQTSYYPLAFTEQAPRLIQALDIPEGTVAYLRKTLGIIQGGYHDEITVRLPDDDEIKFFQLSERARVLVYQTLRTAYDEETGTPFRFSITVWPADRNRLHYNVGKVPQEVVERPSADHRGSRSQG